MNPTDYLALIVDETGRQYSLADLDLPFDELDEWDSVFLMKLLVGIENHTGVPVAMADLLEVSGLGELLRAVDAGNGAMAS